MLTRQCLLAVPVVLALSCASNQPAIPTPWQASLRSQADYRAELAALRAQHTLVRPLPPVEFFLFGMGPRRKLLFRDGQLIDPRTQAVLETFSPTETVILPAEYSVLMRTPTGDVSIVEDEEGVKLVRGGKDTWLARSKLHLPRFSQHRYPGIMRVLLHEVLVNIIDGKPVPNYFVYAKPWYRDSAIMLMVLERTNNVALMADWVLGLDTPFDRNNSGEEEADNPGQALFMISRVADKTHPLVPELLAALKRFEVEDGTYIKGRSDYAFHPVYQTLWAKLGLTALGLPDPYQTPKVPDNYANLFWIDTVGKPEPSGSFSAADTMNYPYLSWAQDHHQGTNLGPLSDRDYPLSWEAHASDANYKGIGVLSPLYEQEKLAAPHTWHAAEMFLLLDEQRQ